MKRKFSLFMAAACLFSSLTFGAVAKAEAPASFTDVTNKTQYYEAIMTLTKLGVINGYANDDGSSYSFKPEGEITRAEFSKIIMSALGAGESAGSSDKFTDIDSHWAKGYIIAAADRGIVNGMGDGTFAPDAKVTYEQAVKMIVCAAGYENLAQSMGGWPAGYIAQASNLGITKDAVSTNNSSPAARGIIAQLMYNVLDVDIPVYDINGSLKKDLDTFMETYLGIIKEKATIVGVEDKVLASYPNSLLIDEMAVMLKDGTAVVMDYTSYTEDKALLEEHLGQAVVVYYIEGKSGAANTLYALDFESSKNTVTTLISEDIEGYSSDSLSYYDSNEKLRSFDIDSSKASVYYNGKLVSSPATALATYLDPAQATFMYGEVKLTDSGSDNSIDIVEITDYEFLVVSKTPSTTDYVVTNKVKFSGTAPDGYLSSVALDPDEVTYTVSITNASGAEIAPTSLKANDVLLVAQSEDQKIRTVRVCAAPVTGKITATSTAQGTVTINNKEYKVTDYANTYFAENGIKTETSSQGTFYIDIYDSIVYGTQTATAQSTSPYAYIIRAVVNDDEDGGTLTAYVPTSNGVKTYNMSGKVKYNGEMKPVSDVVDALRTNVPTSGTNVAVPDNNSTVYPGSQAELSNASQIARITVSGSDVEEIIVAEPADYLDSSAYGKTTEDTMAIVPYMELTSKTVYKGSNNFDGKFYVNSSTTFIYVPQDRSENKSYAKRTVSSFDGGASYWVQPYNVNSSKVANLVVIYGKETQTITLKNNDQPWILAENHATSVKDDEQVYDISYYASKDAVTKKTGSVTDNVNVTNSDVDYTLADLGNITMGDFFRAGTDSTAGLVNAEIVVDFEAVKSKIAGDCDFNEFTWYSNTRSSDSYSEVFVANVIEVLDDGGKFSLRVTSDGFDSEGNLPEDNERLIAVGSAIIYRVSADGTKITPFLEGSDTEKITADELREAKYEGKGCSKVGIFAYTGTLGNNKAPKMILIYE